MNTVFPLPCMCQALKYREIAEKIIFAAWNSKKVVSFFYSSTLAGDSYVIFV